MTKRTTPEQPEPANLSPKQMKSGIPKLERRIAELQAIDVGTIQERGEPRLIALQQKIDDTLVEIFGNNTIEYNRYYVKNLDWASGLRSIHTMSRQ